MSAGQVRTCTRASTLAKALDAPGDGLMDYASATTVQGLVAHPDLMTRAQLIDPSGSWRDFKGVVEEVKARRGKIEASGGTNVHAAVEAIVRGRSPRFIPDDVRKPAEMVLGELASLGVRVAHTERFVAALGVWDEDVAGTCDLVLELDGRYYIGDVKSVEVVGKNSKFSAMAWALQMTAYAAGRPLPEGHEPKRDRWGRPAVDPAIVEDWALPMDQATGLVIEVARDGSGVTSHEIDLDRDLVALACKVRAARKLVRV